MDGYAAGWLGDQVLQRPKGGALIRVDILRVAPPVAASFGCGNHSPGVPVDPEPPDRLVELANTIADPLVVQSGVTTTADGKWALYVTVPRDCSVPISSVERSAAGFPVVYEAEPDEPPRAGPADPRRA